MSWLGVKYALACRDENVKGGVRLVLVALGARLEYRRITTSPTSLSELQWLTLMSQEQIRRNIDALGDAGKVRRVTRGKNAVYALPEMAGPLFAVDDGDPVKMTDFVIEELPPEIGRNARKVSRRMTDFSGRRAGGVFFSEVHRTEVPPTTSAAISTAFEQEAADFFEWFCVTYGTKRGYPYRIKREAALAVIRELLQDRTTTRLQAMALLMFDAVRDTFITTSDYSLFVLQHKATYLEGIAVRNEQAPREAAR